MRTLARALKCLLAATALGSLACASAGRPAPNAVDWQGVAATDSARLILVTFELEAPHTLRRAGSTPRAYGGPRTYGVSGLVASQAAALARANGLERVDAWPILPLGVHCVVYRVPPGVDVDVMLDRLARTRGVESAQPLNQFEVQTSSDNDPYLPFQHDLLALGVEAAHRWATGAGVRVAVVDSGVEASHPDLAGRVSTRDFVGDGPGNPYTPDAHGTGVAGVIAAASNNGVGIVGVAPGVRILALRACWPRGTDGGQATCNSFTLARALAWALSAASPPPQVINLSLAGPEDPLLGRLVQRATEQGIAVVAAVREGGSDPGFPASVPGVIAVSVARGRAVQTAGTTPPGVVAAPGTDVLTTLPRGTWGYLSGSSLAAAYVSGVAALLLEAEPRLSPAQLRSRLGRSSRGGSLSVDACIALASVLPQITCPAPATSRAVPDPGRRRSDGTAAARRHPPLQQPEAALKPEPAPRNATGSST